MKFFIDTANVDDIRKANDMGVICGVTTNPSLIAKEGRDFNEVIKEITTIVDGPISGEVKATTVDAEGMIKEGREIAKIHPNMVVKIPMTVEGLKAVKVLAAEGIKTNVTLIFSANQALLAARAGATYVSPFLGRLDDISQPGINLIEDIVQIFDNYGLDTEIIAASVRNPIHVTDCALAGAHIATVPYAVIEQMTKHPLTDQGIEKFKSARARRQQRRGRQQHKSPQQQPAGLAFEQKHQPKQGDHHGTHGNGQGTLWHEKTFFREAYDRKYSINSPSRQSSRGILCAFCARCRMPIAFLCEKNIIEQGFRPRRMKYDVNRKR